MNRSEQFDQLIVEYLDAQRRQQAPSRGQMIAWHPEFATELNSFFDNQALLVSQVPAADPAATLPPEAFAGAAGWDANRVRYFGDYELLEEIARGGMGVVFKARQVSLNRIVALKMILAGQFASPADVQRFRLEAEAAANLDHPNILPIYEVGEHEGQQYFSMKYVDGGTLAGRMRNRNADSTDDAEKKNKAVYSSAQSAKSAFHILKAVARAVHFAHQRGIIHRDLKPGNILLQSANEARPLTPDSCSPTPDSCSLIPYVADFGLAKRIESDSKQTQTGAIVGTPTYMAPEQARSEKQLTTAVDVYALGAMLYEVICGQPPFAGPTPVDVIMQVLEQDPPPPSKVSSNVDRDLATIAMKCLEKDPIQRYATAGELADDLDRWSNGEPIKARPGIGARRLLFRIRRHPWLVAAISAAVLLVVTLLSYGFYSTLRSRAWMVHYQNAQLARLNLPPRAGGGNDSLRQERINQAWNELAAAAKLYPDRRLFDEATFLTAEQQIGVQQFTVQPDEWKLAVSQSQRNLGQRPTLTDDGRHLLWHGVEVDLTNGHTRRLSMDNPVTAQGDRAGRCWLTLDRKGVMRVWDRATEREIKGIDRRPRRINCYALSPDGRLAVFAHNDKTEEKDIKDSHCEIVATDNDQPPVQLEFVPGMAWDLFQFSRDNRFVAAKCSYPRAICRWDVATGKRTDQWQDQDVSVLGYAFSFNDDLTAFVHGSGPEVSVGSILVRRFPSGEIVQTFSLNERTTGYRFPFVTPDQRFCVAHWFNVSNGQNDVVVWDQRTNPATVHRFRGDLLAFGVGPHNTVVSAFIRGPKDFRPIRFDVWRLDQLKAQTMPDWVESSRTTVRYDRLAPEKILWDTAINPQLGLIVAGVVVLVVGVWRNAGRPVPLVFPLASLALSGIGTLWTIVRIISILQLPQDENSHGILSIIPYLGPIGAAIPALFGAMTVLIRSRAGEALPKLDKCTDEESLWINEQLPYDLPILIVQVGIILFYLILCFPIQRIGVPLLALIYYFIVFALLQAQRKDRQYRFQLLRKNMYPGRGTMFRDLASLMLGLILVGMNVSMLWRLPMDHMLPRFDSSLTFSLDYESKQVHDMPIWFVFGLFLLLSALDSVLRQRPAWWRFESQRRNNAA